MLAATFKVHWTDEAGACSPKNRFLSVSFADFEIAIEELSWADRRAFPVFAHILNRKIREFDFLSGRVFHTRSIRSLLPGRGVSVGNWAGDRQQTAEQKDESRIIFHSLKVR